jgi:hypothetical protein
VSLRLKKSVEEMAVFCRELVYKPDHSGIGGWWSGRITPLKAIEHLLELLDDIHHHKPVDTAAHAELRHLSGCTAEHCHHAWMDKVRPNELLRSFNIRVGYSGTKADPRCWVEGINLQNGRHMWTDGSICPFKSSSATWDWMRDTVTDFMGHVSIFLVSWMVFHQTTVWLVGECGNSPGYHISNIKPSQLCWCRSGRKYSKCHMQKDSALFMRYGV